MTGDEKLAELRAMSDQARMDRRSARGVARVEDWATWRAWDEVREVLDRDE